MNNYFLENQFRGLDEDESEFLDKIDKMKRNTEKKKKEEEQDLLKQQIRADSLATSLATNSNGLSLSDLKPKIEKFTKDDKKNKESLKKLIVKRKANSVDQEASDSKVKKVEDPKLVKIQKKPEVKANKLRGLLKGYV